MRVATVALALCVLGACSSSGSSKCVPGASVECACANGRKGAQRCLADGTFEPCSCEGGDSRGSSLGGEDQAAMREKMALREAAEAAEIEARILQGEIDALSYEVERLTTKLQEAQGEAEKAAAQERLEVAKARLDAVKASARRDRSGERAPVGSDDKIKLDPRCISDPNAPGC